MGVRRDMEKKEKAVFGILVLGKDWRKINVFQVLGDSGMRFWEKKRCDGQRLSVVSGRTDREGFQRLFGNISGKGRKLG